MRTLLSGFGAKRLHRMSRLGNASSGIPTTAALRLFKAKQLPGEAARRRVSFESVPPSPNTRRKNFSFTPISPGPRSPDASPFVSPRNTPKAVRRPHESAPPSPVLPKTFFAPAARPQADFFRSQSVPVVSQQFAAVTPQDLDDFETSLADPGLGQGLLNAENFNKILNILDNSHEHQQQQQQVQHQHQHHQQQQQQVDAPFSGANSVFQFEAQQQQQQQEAVFADALLPALRCAVPSRSVPSTPLPSLSLAYGDVEMASRSYPSTPTVYVNDFLLNGQPVKDADELLWTAHQDNGGGGGGGNNKMSDAYQGYGGYPDYAPPHH